MYKFSRVRVCVLLKECIFFQRNDTKKSVPVSDTLSYSIFQRLHIGVVVAGIACHFFTDE